MPADALKDAKEALERIIAKSRVHMYKPIQVAEILHRHRTEAGWNLAEVEAYRNPSKSWRDAISLQLVGRRSTSTQKFQDNLFESNAMPPGLLAVLGEANVRGDGAVETYIYASLRRRLAAVHAVFGYVNAASPATFSLDELLSFFEQNPGLKKSVDKIYEIVVYALFGAIVKALDVEVALEIRNKDPDMAEDFAPFIGTVLGIEASSQRRLEPAALFRVGTTNAADTGLDLIANFGAGVQVKHLELTADLLADIQDSVQASSIVVVCRAAERRPLESLAGKTDALARIQGIITVEDLRQWYRTCMNEKYGSSIGGGIIRDIASEIANEFPSSDKIADFMAGRGYAEGGLPDEWRPH